MAKYIVQVMVHGSKIVAQALARAFQQEFAAASTASQNGSSKASTIANIKHDMTLREALDILNVKSLNNQEEIEKKFSHLFAVNEKSKGGSLYLQSKEKLFYWQLYAPLGIITHWCCYSHTISHNVFSNTAKENFIRNLKSYKYISVKREVEAAVMVPLCVVNGEPSVLFTVRSSTLDRDKSDVSFPGGMRDSDDKDAVQVAIRETEEEIGISSDTIDIWTTMNSLPGRDINLGVKPVVAFIGNIEIENCKINKDEVAVVFTRTLQSLCDLNKWRYTKYKAGYSLPIYLDDEYRIWGLTAAVLQIVLHALLPENYPKEYCIFLST